VPGAASAEVACKDGERARLAAAEQAPEALGCKLVRATPIGATLQAALLELEDEEQDIPLVLVFGAERFTYVARLLSIDDSTGASGAVAIERFEVLDAVPGASPEVVLMLQQRATWAEDAPPEPEHVETKRWLFVCESEPNPRCLRMLLAASGKSEKGAAFAHAPFALKLTLDGGSYRLERVSGTVPRPYAALLGDHELVYLVEALQRLTP
jgi:hypothetical protein